MFRWLGSFVSLLILFSFLQTPNAFASKSNALRDLPSSVLSLKQLQDRSVQISINLSAVGIDYRRVAKAELLRSTSKRMLINEDLSHPVFKRDLLLSYLFYPVNDDYVADNTQYFYALKITDKNGSTKVFDMAAITTANRELEVNGVPTILIDKEHYLLDVLVDGQIMKRYPVVFGADPVTQKRFSDFSTTPEGIYKIIGVREKAQFHRAFDINYPNRDDRLRYQQMSQTQQLPEIGGDIQIHGSKNLTVLGPLDANWTWGCISLRNSDIDEIFNTRRFRIGIKVAISGSEISRDEMESALAQ